MNSQVNVSSNLSREAYGNLKGDEDGTGVCPSPFHCWDKSVPASLSIYQSGD